MTLPVLLEINLEKFEKKILLDSDTIVLLNGLQTKVSNKYYQQ